MQRSHVRLTGGTPLSSHSSHRRTSRCRNLGGIGQADDVGFVIDQAHQTQILVDMFAGDSPKAIYLQQLPAVQTHLS